MTTEAETKSGETRARESTGRAKGRGMAAEAEAKLRGAEGIGEQVQSEAASVFEQAVQTFGDAIKAGVKIQEDVARWWTDVFDQAGAAQTWQKRSRAIVNETIPAVQKTAEEWLRVIEQNYRRSIELFKMAMDSEQTGAGTAARNKNQELWEASLQFVRDSAQSLAQTNVKVMEQWSDILRKNMECEEEES